MAKERLTFMVTANYTGSEKSKLLVIGTSAKPRGFPQNMKHFPVNYESNKTAWMTADIWSRYLMRWDAQLRIEGRFILLLEGRLGMGAKSAGSSNRQQERR